MSIPISFGNLEMRSGASATPTRRFHIALLGDFSGRASRGLCEPATLASRRLVQIDRDCLEERFGQLGVELRLVLPGQSGPPVSIRFRNIDDFHPDRLYERVEVFQALRALRRRLSDPRTFAAAAAEVWGAKAAEPAPALPPPPPATVLPAATEGLLESMLEGAMAEPGHGAPAPRSPWNELIAGIVQPYLVARPDPRQAECVRAVDDSAARWLREILHHPEFQALEALWRGVDLLLRRLDTDGELQLFLLDVTRAEWAADLTSSDDLRSTGLYRCLVERTTQTPGATPWAVLGAGFFVGPTAEDAALAGRMAKIAGQAGAPFLAGADPRLVGCTSLLEHPDPDDWDWSPAPEDAAAWQSLRSLAEARWVGLAMPRFLLRLPYGPKTTPTEQFPFDEMPGQPDHAAYLWGNPALACALLLGQAFNASGWRMRPGEVRDIDDLPVHVYPAEGEMVMQPCAEIMLVDRAAEAILDHGIMPLRSFAHRGAVRLERFQSMALPATPLGGAWR